MSLKVLETNITGLLESVARLTDEVGSLRSMVKGQNELLTKQSSIISTQGELIALIKTELEGKSPLEKQKTTASTDALVAKQRPIRQVRLNAAAAVAAAAQKPSGGSNRPVAANVTSTPKLPEANVSEPKQPVVKTKLAHKLPITRDGTVTADVADTVTDVHIISDTNENNWSKVEKKRSNYKMRKIITGSGQTDDELQTVERLKHIQAWSFNPDTTASNVLKYLNKIKPCDKYTVLKRDIKTDRHAAFVIGFPESMYQLISSPSTWPPLVKVSDWFLVRRRGEGAGAARGGQSTATEPQRRHARTT